MENSEEEIVIMLFINFKNYPQASGSKAVLLAQTCEEVSADTGIPIIPCVASTDLINIARTIKCPVWVQHIDPIDTQKSTGFITPSVIKAHGSWGTLLNHSEHKMEFEEIKKAVLLAKQNSLRTMVLVENSDLARKVDELAPDYIGIEEPSLIASNQSMSRSEKGKQKIKEFIAVVKNAVPLVGAGISEKSDIRESLSLGAKGILVSSAVVKAKNPAKILKELAGAFQN